MKTLKQYISLVINGKAFSNFFHLGLNQSTNVLVALLATPYLFQNLGEEEFGLVNLALSIVFLLAVLVNYGFNLNAPKRIALVKDNREELSLLISKVLAIRIIIGSAVSAVLFFSIIVFDLFDHYGTLLIFSLLILLSEAFLPQFILQGLDKLKWFSLANAASKLIYLLLLYLFIQDVSDSKWVNFLLGGSSLLINVLLLLYIFQKLGLEFVSPSFRKIKASILGNFHFFLSTIAGQVSVYGGIIILANFVSDAELGKYSLAQRVAFLLRMIPVFIAQAILQNASRLFEQDRKQFNHYLNKVNIIGLSLTATISILVFVLSDWIIALVGREYVKESADFLRILGFLPFLGMLNIPNMIKILVAEHQNVLLKATWVSAIFMLIISPLSAKLFGALGLSVSLLITELFNYIIHTHLVNKHSNLKQEFYS